MQLENKGQDGKPRFLRPMGFGGTYRDLVGAASKLAKVKVCMLHGGDRVKCVLRCML